MKLFKIVALSIVPFALTLTKDTLRVSSVTEQPVYISVNKGELMQLPAEIPVTDKGAGISFWKSKEKNDANRIWVKAEKSVGKKHGAKFAREAISEKAEPGFNFDKKTVQNVLGQKYNEQGDNSLSATLNPGGGHPWLVGFENKGTKESPYGLLVG